MKFEYHTIDYFNPNDTYLFWNPSFNKVFLSKVHFYNGYWFTTESLNYKTTTIKCFNVTSLTK